MLTLPSQQEVQLVPRGLKFLYTLASPNTDIQGKFSVTTEIWGRRKVRRANFGYSGGKKEVMCLLDKRVLP